MNRKMLKILAATSLAMGALSTQAQVVSSLDNASFEVPNTSDTGWYAEDGTLIRARGGAQSGTYSALLDSSTSIQQSFTSNYTGNLAISFWAWGSGGIGLYNSVDVGANDYSHPIIEDTFSTPAAWTQQTYNFSAINGNSYHLYFDGQGTGLKLDNVGISVAAVPEPETYAMLLAGLGVLGFTGRRRMKQG
jgi:hypothetical protein